MSERCVLCGAEEGSHYDGVQCPIGGGKFSATHRFTRPREPYTPDAYISEVPEGWGGRETHFLMVDLVESDGKIVHQAIAGIFGKNNAEYASGMMNRWRDQTAASRGIHA